MRTFKKKTETIASVKHWLFDNKSPFQFDTEFDEVVFTFARYGCNNFKNFKAIRK